MEVLEMDGWIEMEWTTLLNVWETADLLGVSPSTVYRLVSRGRIPFQRFDRRILFLEPELERWIAREWVAPGQRRDLKRLQ
jgi:excisionase family DNA binding protein